MTKGLSRKTRSANERLKTEVSEHRINKSIVRVLKRSVEDRLYHQLIQKAELSVLGDVSKSKDMLNSTLMDLGRSNQKMCRTSYQRNFKNSFEKEELIDRKREFKEKVRRFYSGNEPLDYFRTEISPNGTPKFIPDIEPATQESLEQSKKFRIFQKDFGTKKALFENLYENLILMDEMTPLKSCNQQYKWTNEDLVNASMRFSGGKRTHTADHILNLHASHSRTAHHAEAQKSRAAQEPHQARDLTPSRLRT